MASVQYGMVRSFNALSKEEAALDEEGSEDKGIGSTFFWTFSTDDAFYYLLWFNHASYNWLRLLLYSIFFSEKITAAKLYTLS